MSLGSVTGCVRGDVVLSGRNWGVVWSKSGESYTVLPVRLTNTPRMASDIVLTDVEALEMGCPQNYMVRAFALTTFHAVDARTGAVPEPLMRRILDVMRRTAETRRMEMKYRAPSAKL